MKRKLIKLILNSLILTGMLVYLQGCSDDDDTTPNGNGAACVIASAPSYFGGPQNFTYGKDGMLTTRSYSFNVGGYSDLTQTIDAGKSIYSYTRAGNLVEETDVFTGGTGNIYDGQPEAMIKTEHQKYADGRPDLYLGPDPVLSFGYDDKKRLTNVTYYRALQTYSVQVTYSRQFYGIQLELVYDDNDNVTSLTQTYIKRYGVYVTNAPSESKFYYDYLPETKINITYDNKPSPYTAILKYWKFLQGDWGYTSNSNWQQIIIKLSKNNPVTINYTLLQGKTVDQTSTFTYTYNEKGFPTDGYTYNCQ